MAFFVLGFFQSVGPKIFISGAKREAQVQKESNGSTLGLCIVPRESHDDDSTLKK